MKALVDQVHDRRLRHNARAILIIAASLFLTGAIYIRQQSGRATAIHHRPLHAEELLDTCASLKIIPGPPDNFSSRSESDRFVPGTVPTYIKNATIWIGRSEGLIVKVGHITKGDLPSNYDTIDAAGGVYMNSSVPMFSYARTSMGASDGNSLKGPAQPWLRSLDGLNTHDESVTVYGFTRLDTQWSFRKSYEEARKIKKKQDDFCAKVEAGLWNEVPDEYPESLQWEALVDVLRGRVKINNHCYEAVDFDQQIRSDHPVLDSRFLLYEAQQAHLYGLDHDLALASVTTTPAELQGFGHRLGYVKADLVIWDSHPLALGATPILESPKSIKKPSEFQVLPRVPNFDKERKNAIKYEGLQPLRPSTKAKSAVFFNVRTIYEEDKITGKLMSQQLSEGTAPGMVI
ncbi:6700_t:CDS:2, partial [Acaulospora colombiana]